MVFSVRYQYSIYLWMHTKVLAFKISILFPEFFSRKIFIYGEVQIGATTDCETAGWRRKTNALKVARFRYFDENWRGETL